MHLCVFVSTQYEGHILASAYIIGRFHRFKFNKLLRHLCWWWWVMVTTTKTITFVTVSSPNAKKDTQVPEKKCAVLSNGPSTCRPGNTAHWTCCQVRHVDRPFESNASSYIRVTEPLEASSRQIKTDMDANHRERSERTQHRLAHGTETSMRSWTMAMNRGNGYDPTWGLPLMMMMMQKKKSSRQYNTRHSKEITAGICQNQQNVCRQTIANAGCSISEWRPSKINTLNWSLMTNSNILYANVNA